MADSSRFQDLQSEIVNRESSISARFCYPRSLCLTTPSASIWEVPTSVSPPSPPKAQLIEKITLGVKVALGRDYVIGEMCDAIHRLTEQYRTSGSFLGAGIGVPGIIDMEAGMMRKSANLPGWSDYPVRDEIERRLGARVFLDNDANVAALGEKWLGAGRDADNMAMLTLGTGIGGAIVLNGKLFYGMSGMAGEFGHVTIEPNGVPCGCGNHGCAERYASATAVVRMAREAIESGKAPELAKAANSDPEFSAKSIYNLAIQGNARCPANL